MSKFRDIRIFNIPDEARVKHMPKPKFYNWGLGTVIRFQYGLYEVKFDQDYVALQPRCARLVPHEDPEIISPIEELAALNKDVDK